MSKWSSILRWASTPLRSPQRTLAGAGSAVKSATFGAGVGYVGWEALMNDKPVVQTVGETLVGKETNEAIKEGVHGTVSVAADTIGAAKDMIGSASDAVGSISSSVGSANTPTSPPTWGGVGEFVGNVVGGTGTNMFGNLFSNIFSGKVSMLSMLGLVASSMLLFGRFGWVGKIAGALLGMMLVGNNSKVVQQQPKLTPSIEEDNSRQSIRR